MVDENMRVTKEKETLEHEQEIVRKAESEANDEPSDEPELIQLYSQDELNGLIEKHEHLKRVKDDDCQFVRDIKDRASVLRYPSYSYLLGRHAPNCNLREAGRAERHPLHEVLGRGGNA